MEEQRQAALEAKWAQQGDTPQEEEHNNDEKPDGYIGSYIYTFVCHCQPS